LRLMSPVTGYFGCALDQRTLSAAAVRLTALIGLLLGADCAALFTLIAAGTGLGPAELLTEGVLVAASHPAQRRLVFLRSRGRVSHAAD
jgi:hypothetical protein